jgi:hypothetical protein
MNHKLLLWAQPTTRPRGRERRMMKKFRLGIRIVVNNPDHILFGHFGVIVRIRFSDDGAWTDMDKLEPKFRKFPDGDPRQNHYLLYPEDCEELHLVNPEDCVEA